MPSSEPGGSVLAVPLATWVDGPSQASSVLVARRPRPLLLALAEFRRPLLRPWKAPSGVKAPLPRLKDAEEGAATAAWASPALEGQLAEKAMDTPRPPWSVSPLGSVECSVAVAGLLVLEEVASRCRWATSACGTAAAAALLLRHTGLQRSRDCGWKGCCPTRRWTLPSSADAVCPVTLGGPEASRVIELRVSVSQACKARARPRAVWLAEPSGAGRTAAPILWADGKGRAPTRTATGRELRVADPVVPGPAALALFPPP
mmetsp:Transcript_30870/g.67570  ORF Transcript_30870/g.67570 Transcript_30870/m.67570 type:complete len:260 (+) Transcript_30870:916-1695(+)